MKWEMSRSNNRGFTILEPLLAGTLLAVVTLSIVHGINYAERSVVTSMEHRKALFLAQEGLEAVRSIRDASFDEVAINSWGISGDATWDFAMEPDVIDDYYTRLVTITEDGDAAFIVESSVSWEGIAGEQTTTLVSRLTNWQ